MFSSDIYEGTKEWKFFLAQESSRARQESATNLRQTNARVSSTKAAGHKDRGNELFGLKSYEKVIQEYIHVRGVVLILI
jgi:hypothetical protein